MQLVMIPFAIKKHLSASGFIVKHLKSVDSTNDYIKTLSNDELKEGLVVVADQQTGGKGRLGRKFFSPKGGLYFSILLKPAKKEVLDKLTLIAAVATVDAIKETCKDDANIKWINDIYILGKKCCGILAETSENVKGFAILGIGVNIGNASIDESINDIACGVTKQGDNTRWELLLSILSNFKELYSNFDNDKIVADYKNRCSTIGKNIKVFENNGNEYIAQATDIDSEGHLIVRSESGDLHVLDSGEVKILG